MTSMGADRLRVLSDEECIGHLRRERLGRIAVAAEAVTEIFPVNYALLDDEVVFRTAPGHKLIGAILERAVSFEVDWAATDGGSGWSVLIVGHASRLVYAPLLDRARHLDLRPWAPGDRDYYVKISTERISGRSYGPSDVS